MIAHEDQDEESRWHPVGKYLGCQSIELSLKAFLMLRGTKKKEAESFRPRLVELLGETRKQNLEEFVHLTGQEFAEIEKASKGYYEYPFAFRYPDNEKILNAYPGDPEAALLLSATQKLVDGLFDRCKAA